MGRRRRMELVRRHLSFGRISAVVATGLALSLPGPAALGAGGQNVQVTPVQPSHRGAASAVLLRAVRLTHELRGLAVQVRTAAHHRTELSRRIVTIARAREAAVLALVAHDPQAAGHLILPRQTRHVLAAIRGADVERSFAVEGRHVIVTIEHDPHDLNLDRLVTSGGRVFELYGISSQATVGLTSARTDVAMAAHGFELGGRLLATRISAKNLGFAATA